MEILLTPMAEHLGLEAQSFLPHPERGKRVFPDGETFTRLPETDDKKVLLVHSGQPEPDRGLSYLRTALRILKDQGKKVSVLFTYFPYSLQDREFFPGTANIARELLKEMKEYYGVEKIAAIDPHFGGRDWIPDYFRSVSVMDDMLDGYNSVILAPDEGGGRRFGADFFEKRRTEEGIELKGSFDVSGKDVMVVDDLVESGTTLLKSYDRLKQMGAEEVSCCVVHGVREEGLERIQPVFRKVRLSNSIQNTFSSFPVEQYIRSFAERI